VSGLVKSLPFSAVAVVFDLDNTLVASHIDFKGMREEVIGCLRAHGVLLTAEQTAWPVGRLADLPAGMAGVPADLSARLWEVIDAYETEGMIGAALEPGALEAVGELHRRGHPLAVLTNNARTSAMKALTSWDLLPYFTLVLCRGDVAHLKPAPDGLLAVRQALGQPQRLFMVGDSWLDGAAATAAGAYFIAVGPNFRPRDGIAVRHHIATLHELPVLDLVGEGDDPLCPQQT